MRVTTQSRRLADLGRGVMELYISDHPLDCLTCTANGNCELQDMAGVVGLREVRYGMAGENHFDAEHAELEAFADAAEGRAPYPVPQSQMIANISALEAAIKSTQTGKIVDVES